MRIHAIQTGTVAIKHMQVLSISSKGAVKAVFVPARAARQLLAGRINQTLCNRL